MSSLASKKGIWQKNCSNTLEKNLRIRYGYNLVLERGIHNVQQDIVIRDVPYLKTVLFWSSFDDD